MVRRIKRLLCVAAWLVCSLAGFAQYSVNFVDSVITVIDGNAHPTGVIYDNGGPNGKYKNNFAGMVRIDADLGDTIVLWGHVKTYEASDQLFVYESDGREDLIGAYCKDTIFSTQSTTGCMSLWFSTDFSMVDSGFTLYYEVHYNSCSNNVMQFVATDIAPTSVRLQWSSPDTTGPFLLSVGDRDTILNQSFCDVTDLSSDTNYTFIVVSLADTGNTYCPRSCTIHTPCFIAGISGVRPLIGRRDFVVLVADSADGYIWNTGATTRELVVTEPGDYYVVAVTAGGCSDTARARVIRVSLVLDINIPPCLCPGDMADVHVGFDRDATVRVIPGSAVLSVAQRIFLPDGIYCDPYGCSYRSEQEFSGFPNGACIEDVNDIRYVRLKIEHSWLGDLYMNITCPNGQSANILKFGGLGTSACNSTITTDCRGWDPGNNASLGSYLGQAYDYCDTQNPCDSLASHNRKGEGWNYCWSSATDGQYQYAPGDGRIYRAWNMVRSSIDSSDFRNGRQFYHPDDSFSNLVGCPMNGTWYIEVIDGWSDDNGYIFGWELALDSNRLMRNSYFPFIKRCDLRGPWYERLSDTTFLITAPDTISRDTLVEYKLFIYDTNENVFDTFFYVQFRAAVSDTVFDTITENDLPYTYNDTVFYRDTTDCLFHLIREGNCHCDSTVHYNLFVKRSSSFTKDTIICDDALPYTWHGYNFADSGTIVDTIPNHWDLDSIITLKVTVIPTYVDTIYDTICGYESFYWDDTLYSDTGFYTLFSKTSQYGCDSSRYLDLEVYPIQCFDTIVTACDSFSFGGRTYDSSVLDTIPLASIDSNGCIPFSVLHLTINYSSTFDTSVRVCDSFEWFGTHHQGALDTVISHRSPSENAAGCDSIIRLALAIRMSDTIVINDTICENQWVDGYAYLDSLYTAAAHYPLDTILLYHTLTPDSCYRLIETHLHVHSNTDTAIFDTIVENQAASWSFLGTPLHQDTNLSFTIANVAGCDSVIDYHLHILPNVHDTVRITLCENDTLHWNGLILPLDTNTFVVFPSAVGSDSIVHLVLTLKEIQHVTIEEAICQTDTYLFHDRSLSLSGTYIDTLHTVTLPSCDSIVQLTLSVLDTSATDTAAIVCDSFEWYGCRYYASITDSTILSTRNHNGCDSMLRLHLQVNHSDTVSIIDTICQNQWTAGYAYLDSLYTAAAHYPLDTILLYHTLTPDNCYRLIETHLHVHSNTDTAIFDTIVENQAASWTFLGTPLHQDTNLTFTIANAAGCDSVIDYHLHIHPNVHDTVRITLCQNDTLHWNGLILPLDTNTFVIFPSAVSSDSIVHIILSFKPISDTLLYDTICWLESYDFHGSLYDHSGIYIDTLHTLTLPSCDSIVRLSLHVKDTSMTDTLAIACDSFDWHGRHYHQSTLDSLRLPLPNHLGCDSSIRLNLTIHPTTYSSYHDTCVENQLPRTFLNIVCDTDVANVNDTIPNAFGCDSVITYSLHVWRNQYDTIFDTICASQLPHYRFYGLAPSVAASASPQLTHPILFDTLTAHLLTTHQADSFLTLILTVNPIYSAIVIDTFCVGTQYAFDTFFFDTVGLYDINYTTIDRCDSLITLHLSLAPSFLFDIYDTIRLGETIHFADTLISSPGRHPFIRTTTHGCDSLVTLHLYALYNIYDTIYDTICFGDSLLFGGIYRTASGTYSHATSLMRPDTNSVNPSFLILADSVSTLILTALPYPDISLDVKAFCLEEGAHYKLHAATAAPHHRWSSNPPDSLLYGFEEETDILVAPPSPTIYYLVADYAEGRLCPSSDSITLDSVPLVNAEIITTPTRVTFDDREVIAFNKDDHNVESHAWTVWYDSDAPFYESTDTIMLEVPITTNNLRISLVVNNEFCADTDTVIIVVQNDAIYFPNVFTPDLSDNNRFYPQGVGILDLELWIYDRRGALVFHASGLDLQWDGTSNGIPCTQAAYAYRCRYKTVTTPNGWQSKVGTVTLLR